LNRRVAWFDHKDRSKGKVTTRLSTDATKVRGLVGDNLGSVISLMTMLVAGLSIGMTYCWQESLMMMASIPVVVFFSAVRLKMMTGFSNSSEFEVSSSIASQVVENIRTVVAMGAVNTNLIMYSFELNKITKKLRKDALVSGAMYGVTETIMLLIWAVAFTYVVVPISLETVAHRGGYSSTHRGGYSSTSSNQGADSNHPLSLPVTSQVRQLSG
jgi:ABC-type multidrug transport system fused ATPase/permease subunit